jgi:hypothetical protein
MTDTANRWTPTLFTFVFIFMTVGAFYAAHQREQLKVEAVERGYAEWVPDTHGDTVFKWKSPVKEREQK